MPKIRVGVVHAAKRLAKKPAPPKVLRKSVGGRVETHVVEPKIPPVMKPRPLVAPPQPAKMAPTPQPMKRLAKKPTPKVVRKTIGGVIHTEMIKPKPFGTPTGKRGRRT